MVVVVPYVTVGQKRRHPNTSAAHRFSACAACSGKYSGALVSGGTAYFIPSSASNVGSGFGEVRLVQDKRVLGLVFCSASALFIQFVLLALCHCPVCLVKGVFSYSACVQSYFTLAEFVPCLFHVRRDALCDATFLRTCRTEWLAVLLD